MKLKIKILTLLGSIFLSACAVTPSVKDRETIAYNGNNEDAGIIGFLPDGSLEINQSALDRYNGLIKQYGTMFVPNISENFQVLKMESGNYSITLEAAEKWRQMKRFDEYQKVLNKEKNI